MSGNEKLISRKRRMKTKRLSGSSFKTSKLTDEMS
jgi:hypothetical protein